MFDFWVMIGTVAFISILFWSVNKIKDQPQPKFKTTVTFTEDIIGESDVLEALMKVKERVGALKLLFKRLPDPDSPVSIPYLESELEWIDDELKAHLSPQASESTAIQ